MATDLPEGLKYSSRLQEIVESQQRVSSILGPAHKSINQLCRQGGLNELVDQLKRVEEQFDALKSPAEVIGTLQTIQHALATGQSNDMVRRNISELCTMARLTPEIMSSDTMNSILDMQTQIERTFDSPMQRILQSQTAAQALECRLERMAPRYVLGIQKIPRSDGLEDDVAKLVIRDTEASEGERDVDVDVLPGIVSVQDVLHEISSQETMDLYHHLAEFPMLGAEHPVGQRILEGVPTLKYQEFERLQLYRGRSREKDRRPFTEQEMWSPPLEKAAQGRLNPQGLSYLYMCDTLDGAIAESKGQLDMVVDVIQWLLVERIPILDLASDDIPLIKYCQFDSNGQIFKPEYLIPNYLAQCIAYAGIPAMRLQSVRHPDSMTYVFFTYNREWFERTNFFEGRGMEGHQ